MIFEKYTFRQKFAALLVVFCMLSVAAYKRSFRTLMLTYSEYRDLSEMTQAMGEKSKGIAHLSADLAALDRIIGKQDADKERIQQEIIGFVTQSGLAAIYDLQPVHEFADTRYAISTHRLDITGNFNNLLRVAYAFEKKFTWSRVVSLHFYTQKKNNNPDVLHLKMIFQNYENTK